MCVEVCMYERERENVRVCVCVGGCSAGLVSTTKKQDDPPLSSPHNSIKQVRELFVRIKAQTQRGPCLTCT